MIGLMLVTVLVGQVNPTPLPAPPEAPKRMVPVAESPAPMILTPPASPNPSSTTEDLKVWLLTQLIVELSFNEEKVKEVETRLDKMTDRQVRMLIEFYRDRVAKRDQAEAYRQWYMQQQVVNQAQLDLMRAEGYKEHLQREHQQRIIQGEKETNIMRQNIQNNNRMIYPYYGGFGGYGYGGYYRPW